MGKVGKDLDTFLSDCKIDSKDRKTKSTHTSISRGKWCIPENKIITLYKKIKYNHDNNNFTKRGIVDLIADKIKGSKIKYKEGDVDPRNYRVSFKKLESKLNFKTRYNVNDGIDEIIKFIKSNKFENKSLFGNYNIAKNEK